MAELTIGAAAIRIRPCSRPAGASRGDTINHMNTGVATKLTATIAPRTAGRRA